MARHALTDIHDEFRVANIAHGFNVRHPNRLTRRALLIAKQATPRPAATAPVPA